MDSFNINALKQKPKAKQKRTSSKSTNFIEALRSLGSSIKKQTKDATLGLGKGTVDQIFGSPRSSNRRQTGELNPNKSFNFEDFMKSQERQTESRQKQKFENRLKTERLVFYRKEEEAKLQIKSIQEELKKLAKATQGLSQEVEKAVFNGVVEPGAYHFNFLERIRRLIELARKKIGESKTWLESFNQRKKQKQGFYWAKVKKSGTKYMLSQERSTVTQTG